MANSSTYVLIHGAWHDASCWDKTVHLLKNAGHTAIAPDLPGHGRLRTEGARVNLSDYVEAVVHLIKTQSSPVKLVGHSMAGMIISAVAERLPEKIDTLIYVAAYLPSNGDSLMSLARQARSLGLSPYIVNDFKNNEMCLQPVQGLAEVLYTLCSPEDQQLALSALQPQPAQTFFDTVILSECYHRVKKKAIICLQDQTIVKEDQIDMAEKVSAPMVFIEADHSPFLSCPEVLVGVF